MADIYIKIAEANVEALNTRLRALGVKQPATLFNTGLLAVDKALKARLAQDPKNASEDLKAACELPPLHVQEAAVSPFGKPLSGPTLVRSMKRPLRLAEQKKLA